MRGSKLDFSEVARCEISDEVARSAALQPGDIIVSKSSGSPHLVGLPALFEGSPDGQTYLCSNFTMRLRPDSERIQPKYLFHFLAGAKAEADRRSMAQDTAGLRNLKTSEYLSQELPLPPLPEQHRLVEKIERLLSESRTAREALDKVPALLKRFRQSVLAKAFRGELTGRDPGDEPASVLLERIREERREIRNNGVKSKKYVEPGPPSTSGLPELPEGWCWATLEELTSAVRVICYGILMPKENVPDGVLYVKVKDIKDDRINISSLHRTSKEIAAQYARASLTPGDLLLAIRGTYGRVAEVPPELEGANITQDTARLAVSELMDRRYVAMHVRSTLTQNYFKAVARGVAVKGVNIADVRLCPIAVAPFAEQIRIVAKIEGLFAQAEAIERAVEAARRRAEKVDQAVLARAFRGEL